MTIDENLKLFKLSEVAQRNGKELKETWVVVKDSVYNVTDFLEEHPGGADLISAYAGTDCTKDFNDAAHSAEAIKDMKKYKIGELVNVS